MGDPELRIRVEIDDEPHVVSLVGWRRRLYWLAIVVGIVGFVLQILDLIGDRVEAWARVGDAAVFAAVVIPAVLLHGPVAGPAAPVADHDGQTPWAPRSGS
jgi:hypothetical protein